MENTIIADGTAAAKVAYSPGNPLIIAELGTAHNGDLSRAKDMAAAAAEAGATCIKLQMVFADEILHPNTGEVTLPGGKIRLYDRFRQLEMPPEFYAEVKEYVESRGLLFLCTPFGMKSAKILRTLQPKIVKIASPELNFTAMLREVAAWGVPVLLSTGVSTLGDIEEAVGILGSGGKSPPSLQPASGKPDGGLPLPPSAGDTPATPPSLNLRSPVTSHQSPVPLLTINNLHINFTVLRGRASISVQAVRGLSLTLNKGECLGIVGESGSGKSVSTLAIPGLLPHNARVQGSIRYNGDELLGLGTPALREYRGKKIGMIFQEPGRSFDPLQNMGSVFFETFRNSRPGIGKEEAF